MESRAKLAGHPVHQMLIVFPLGLLATAVVFDVISLVTGTPVWARTAFYMIGAGVVTGLAAAIPGTVDWLAIPRLGVGVYDGAHLDAPSSLTALPARGMAERRRYPQPAYAGVDRRGRASA